VLVLLAVAGTVVGRSLGPGELDTDQVEWDVFSGDGTTAIGERRSLEVQIADPEEDVDHHWADVPR
jgi:hypothetical protein